MDSVVECEFCVFIDIDTDFIEYIYTLEIKGSKFDSFGYFYLCKDNGKYFLDETNSIDTNFSYINFIYHKDLYFSKNIYCMDIPKLDEILSPLYFFTDINYCGSMIFSNSGVYYINFSKSIKKLLYRLLSIDKIYLFREFVNEHYKKLNFIHSNMHCINSIKGDILNFLKTINSITINDFYRKYEYLQYETERDETERDETESRVFNIQYREYNDSVIFECSLESSPITKPASMDVCGYHDTEHLYSLKMDRVYSYFD